MSTPEPEQRRVVTLTPAAVQMVKQVMQQHPHKYVKVGVGQDGPDGVAYDFGFADTMDPSEVYIDNAAGLTVIVKRSDADFLAGTVIDFSDGPYGERGLTFNNPNEVSADDQASPQ